MTGEQKKGISEALGIIFALASAVTYGAVSTLGKLALVNSSPILISTVAYMIGAAILFLFKPRERPPRKIVSLVILAGTLGAGIAPYLFFRGLLLTTASNAALLSNGEALFTALLAILFFNEKMTRLQFLSSVVVFSGLLIVTTDLDLKNISFFQGLEGNLMVLLATLVWGIDNNVSRIIGQRMNPTVFTRYKNIVGSVFLLGVLLVSDPSQFPSTNSLPYILLIGIFAVGLSTAFLMNALSRLGAIRAVMLFSTASIFGLVFAVVILGERISFIQILGAVIMFTGLYFMNSTRNNS